MPTPPFKMSGKILPPLSGRPDDSRIPSDENCCILHLKVYKCVIYIQTSWNLCDFSSDVCHLRPHLKEIWGKKRAAGENFLENREKMQEFWKWGAKYGTPPFLGGPPPKCQTPPHWKKFRTPPLSGKSKISDPAPPLPFRKGGVETTNPNSQCHIEYC